MRGVLAAFLIVHGFAHTVGFVVPWRLLPLLAISSLLCALQWSDARVGLLANAVILALLVIGMGVSGLTVP